MAVELTSEQNERLERVLRGIGASMSPEAIAELRVQMTHSMTHPQSAEEIQRELEAVWAMVGEEARRDTRTMDEILGYDEFGLPN